MECKLDLPPIQNGNTAIRRLRMWAIRCSFQDLVNNKCTFCTFILTFLDSYLSILVQCMKKINYPMKQEKGKKKRKEINFSDTMRIAILRYLRSTRIISKNILEPASFHVILNKRRCSFDNIAGGSIVFIESNLDKKGTSSIKNQNNAMI